MKKKRIGVLMGGKSIEREVSFNSGRTVCDHLDTNEYEIIPLFQDENGAIYILPWKFLYRGKTTDFSYRLRQEEVPISWEKIALLIDFMFIAVHGKYAEDGTLQGVLELFDIPYLGSKIFASSLRMNKIRHKKFLSKHNILVPHYHVVYAHQIENFDKNNAFIKKAIELKKLNFPLIVKPANEGSSLGVSAVFSYKDLKQALYLASSIDKREKKDVIVEEKIEGMEFSCIVLHDSFNNTYNPLAPVEIVPIKGTHIFDYEQKYMPGKSIKYVPARCNKKVLKKIQQECIRVMEVMEFCTIGRIDGFVTSDQKVVIIDPNTLTGMDPSSLLFQIAAEAGMDHAGIINHLIKTELQSYH